MMRMIGAGPGAGGALVMVKTAVIINEPSRVEPAMAIIYESVFYEHSGAFTALGAGLDCLNRAVELSSKIGRKACSNLSKILHEIL